MSSGQKCSPREKRWFALKESGFLYHQLRLYQYTRATVVVRESQFVIFLFLLAIVPCACQIV